MTTNQKGDRADLVSLVIYYQSVMSEMGSEIMIIGEDGKVVKSIAHCDNF